MPCHVDTTFEDNTWRQALARHHMIVEQAFEEFIHEVQECRKLRRTTSRAETVAIGKLLKARQILADGYREAYSGLYMKDALEARIKEILEGKRIK